MARRPKPQAPMDVLDEFESQGERLAEWVRTNARWVGAGVGLCLVLAAAYGGQALWRGEDSAMGLGDIDCCGEGEHHHG